MAAAASGRSLGAGVLTLCPIVIRQWYSRLSALSTPFPEEPMPASQYGPVLSSSRPYGSVPGAAPPSQRKKEGQRHPPQWPAAS